MNELIKRFKAHKFQHAEGCKFEKQIQCFDFNGEEIKLSDDDCSQTTYLTIKYCPYCGVDIDLKRARHLIIFDRTTELIEASPIKEGDIIWIKKPNNEYWKGRGFRSVVSKIQYDLTFDRLLYCNWDNKGQNYTYHSSIIEDIELYQGQPICNPVEEKLNRL